MATNKLTPTSPAKSIRNAKIIATVAGLFGTNVIISVVIIPLFVFTEETCYSDLCSPVIPSNFQFVSFFVSVGYITIFLLAMPLVIASIVSLIILFGKKKGVVYQGSKLGKYFFIVMAFLGLIPALYFPFAIIYALLKP